MIFFITSNQNKLLEIELILPEVKQLNIDLAELQEVDAHKIVAHKLQEALKYHQGPLIVEDTSLYLSCLNGLPGPLGKWFEQELGDQKLADICATLGNTNASTSTIIGYAKNPEQILYFEGSVSGQIVQPRGERGFGFNAIFQPEGYKKTFGEMSLEEKNMISMRSIAARKLKSYLAQTLSTQ